MIKNEFKRQTVIILLIVLIGFAALGLKVMYEYNQYIYGTKEEQQYLKTLEPKVMDYLIQNNGYKPEDIKTIKGVLIGTSIRMPAVLVVFKDEPKVEYYYRLTGNNNKIKQEYIYGSTSEDTRHKEK